MKHYFYPALAALFVGSSLIAAGHFYKKRTSNSFYFIPCLTQKPTAATLTNTFNWTIFTSGSYLCVGSSYVCTVIPPSNLNITTSAELAAAIRANNGVIPFSFVVTKQVFCTGH